MGLLGSVIDGCVGAVATLGVTSTVRALRMKPQLRQLQEELGKRMDVMSAELRTEIRSTSADLGSRIGETNARLDTMNVELRQEIRSTSASLGSRIDAVDASLGSRIDAVNARLDLIVSTVGSHEGRIAALERAQV